MALPNTYVTEKDEMYVRLSNELTVFKDAAEELSKRIAEFEAAHGKAQSEIAAMKQAVQDLQTEMAGKDRIISELEQRLYEMRGGDSKTFPEA